MEAQDRTRANNIIAGLQERLRVINRISSYPWLSEVGPGDIAPDSDFWVKIQKCVEAIPTYFVDHINGPLTADGKEVLFYTRASWQAASGLNVSAVPGESFTRDTDSGPAYGYIQAGDLFTETVFDQIERGLNSLRCTRSYSSRSSSEERDGAHTGNIFQSCAHSFSQQGAIWDGASWVSYTDDESYEFVAEIHYSWTWNIWSVWGRRVASKRKYTTDVTDEVDHSATLYVAGTSNSGYTYIDADGIFGAEDVYEPFETFASASVTNRESSAIGKIDENPIVTAGIVCPESVPPWENYDELVTCGAKSVWILTWDVKMF